MIDILLLDEGCGRSAYFWEGGWAWYEENMGLCRAILFCPGCVAKYNVLKQEREELKQKEIRTKQIEEEKLLASLQTREGCLKYLKRATQAGTFGDNHYHVKGADFERLRIALAQAFSTFDLAHDAQLREALLDVFVNSIARSENLRNNIYDIDQPREFLRALDAAWAGVRRYIEERLAVLASDVKSSLYAHAESGWCHDRPDVDDSYGVCLYRKARGTALQLLYQTIRK
jgi:hypothetical protein